MADLDPVQIDGWVFRLHYWVTSTAIFAASAVAFAKQYFGDPIECIFDAKHGAEIKAVDAYCWLHSTVHLDTSLLRKLNSMPQIRSPCLGLSSPMVGLDSTSGPMETLYYQWVPFFLLFQACAFRLPWKLWRHLEGGKMEEFGLEAKRHLLTNEASEILARQYAEAFEGVMHHNNVYFWQFLMCELLNFAVLLVVISFTDFFLGGQFWGYGWRVYDHYITQPQTIPRTNSRPTPMCSLFPTVTSCQFPSGALTGNLNVDHAMCVLSLNIINDKIFLLEWIWFYILALATTASLISSAILVVLPHSRKFWLKQKTRMWSENDREVIEHIMDRCYVGDWFVLHLLSKNTNLYIYKRIIKALANVLRERKVSNTSDARYSLERLEVANGV